MKRCVLLLLTWCVLSSSVLAQGDRRLEYNRDIRPILSNHCFACHGVDDKARQAKLRLDVRDSALAKAESGHVALVPGKPEASELLKRIANADPEVVMPPPSTNKKVSAAEQATLRRWIEQGAEYQTHWAFVAPLRSELPTVKNSLWSKNEIDRFVLARLESESVLPSVQADLATLLRRVSLDLTGLPPTAEELREFISGSSNWDAAYEAAVDRLLASDAFAERLAMQWLDLARYADTNGYNNDEDRTMWPWRDWVIDAFKTNMPFDQFLTEQLAGDLLPNATIDQQIATGFNRNHVITTEGGIFPEEYRVEYVADRVHTTATVFLGLSMQCARCHDHKYDPLTQRDYYRFFGFFNNVPDKTVGYNSGAPAEPYMKVLPKRQRDELAAVRSERTKLEALLTARAIAVTDAVAKWEQTLKPDDLAKLPNGQTLHVPLDAAQGGDVEYFAATSSAADSPKTVGKVIGTSSWADGKHGRAFEFDGKSSIELGQVAAIDRTSAFSFATWIYPTGNGAMCLFSKMDDAAAFRGYDCNFESGKLAVHLVNTWPSNAIKVQTKEAVSLNAWHHVALTYDGSSKASGVKLFVDGKIQTLDLLNDNLRDTLQTDKPFRLGQRFASIPFKGRIDDFRAFDQELPATDVAALAEGNLTTSGLLAVLRTPAAQRTTAQKELVRRHYLETVDADYRRLKADDSKLGMRASALEASSVTTMVMQELPQPRDTFLLRRGQYDQPGDKVGVGVPQSILDLPEGAPLNRLGLARWLTDPRHPLTARVTVNRWWQMLFGNGLVETVEDFGSQGSWPSHPELLDWLAIDFAQNRWNVRATLKRMVLSATYRQSSRATSEQLERDPKNVFLARGPRLRLPAETVRDNALLISGLLSRKIGGPSVKPYQPDGLWQDVSVERRAVYQPSLGEDLYRRSMYTFWKRTCPPPTMTSFDAPDRETCIMRRARTNTPLQALVLLNDPTYLEAARKLAERVLKSDAKADAERLSLALQFVVARPSALTDEAVLLPILTRARQRFAGNKEAAAKLVSIGAASRDQTLPVEELAAWTSVTSVLLNLDEAITKE